MNQIRTLRWIPIFLTVALALPPARAATQFQDPAPPVVANLAEVTAPTPQKNSDATFHAAPKPLPDGAVTSDWPSLLGPTHSMFSPETKLLKEFPKDGLPLVWEMNRGDGYAGPAIAGERLILFHRIGDNEVVECLNALTGERYWQQRYPTAYRDRYGYNHGPRCSPVIGGDWVYTFGAEGKLHCLKLQTGQVRWQRDLHAEFKVPQDFFGVGAAPLLVGDRLIINLGAPGGPCVAAFDTATGKFAWGAGREWGPSYAAPVLATVRGRQRVFVFAGGESRPATGGLICLDPATGAIDFSFPWRGTRYESVNASAPVVIGNQVFVSECYGSGGALLDVLENGTSKLIWTNQEFGTHFMTAIPKDGYLYGIDGHGPRDAYFACVKLQNGKEVWREQPTWTENVGDGKSKRAMTLGTFRTWLLPVDGRCLALGEYGHLLWLDLNPKGYRELSRSWLFAAADTWTPPVLSHGLLYICQNTREQFHNTPPRLLCYDLRAAP